MVKLLLIVATLVSSSISIAAGRVTDCKGTDSEVNQPAAFEIHEGIDADLYYKDVKVTQDGETTWYSLTGDDVEMCEGVTPDDQYPRVRLKEGSVIWEDENSQNARAAELQVGCGDGDVVHDIFALCE